MRKDIRLEIIQEVARNNKNYSISFVCLDQAMNKALEGMIEDVDKFMDLYQVLDFKERQMAYEGIKRKWLEENDN